MNPVLMENGYLVVKGMVPKDLYQYLTHLLSRAADIGYGGPSGTDVQVKTAKVSVHHEIVFETVLEQLWPYIEVAVGEELLPTYAFARLYSNKDVLEEHIDRPECEISVTIQLGRSHHYSWPIYMGNTRLDLAEGDGVIYLGNSLQHRREVCEGPENYYSGQVFLHYVRKNGEFADRAGDMAKRPGVEQMTFVKNRTIAMEEK